MNIKHTFFVCYRAPQLVIREMLERSVPNTDILRSEVGRGGGSFHVRTETSFESLCASLQNVGGQIIKRRKPKCISKFRIVGGK